MKILIAASGFDSPRKHEVNIFCSRSGQSAADGQDTMSALAAVDTRSIRHSRPWGCYRYTLDGIPVYYASVPCGALPMGLPELAGRLAASGIRRAIAKDGWKPDVIHQHFGFELAAMAEREGIPFVFTEHSSLHNRALSPEKAEHLKRKYECCAAVLAVSLALAKNMRANTGVEAIVVPNIVDTARFAPKRIAHERFTFVSAGNLIPVKNMAGLLHGVRCAARRAEAYHFRRWTGERRAAGFVRRTGAVQPRLLPRPLSARGTCRSVRRGGLLCAGVEERNVRRRLH